MRSLAPGAPVQPAVGEGIVFGRVRVFDRGQEITPWKRELSEIFAEDPVIRLSLFQADSERRHPDVAISEEGRFAWILPVGTYLIYHTPSIEPPFNEPLAAFQVVPDSEPIDLGELLVYISVDRPLRGDLATYTLSRVSASPASEGTAAWFVQAHPGTGRVRHGSFIVDPALGSLFVNWSRAACARILAEHGLQMNEETQR